MLPFGLMGAMSGEAPGASGGLPGLPPWLQSGFLGSLLGGGGGAGGAGDIAANMGNPYDAVNPGGVPPGQVAPPVPGVPASPNLPGMAQKGMMDFGKQLTAMGAAKPVDLKPNAGPAPPASSGQMAGAGMEGLMQLLQGTQGQFPLLPQSSLGGLLGPPPAPRY